MRGLAYAQLALRPSALRAARPARHRPSLGPPRRPPLPRWWSAPAELLPMEADFDRFRYLRLRAREVAILRRRSWATAEGVPLFSVASIWEVAIKFFKGRSDFQVPPVTLRRGLLRNGYAEVPIEGGAAEVVQSLPAIHGDPFDRMLVAQARVLGVPLWTCDAKVSEYGPGVRLI